MSTVRFERTPGEQARLSVETRARLAHRTDEQIEAAALADPDAQPLTDEQIDRMVFRRDLRLAREALGLDLDEFAEALRLPSETVRDWERGAVPDPAARTLLRLVARDPETVVRLIAA